MTMVMVLAALVLGMAIVLFGGTILVYVQAACSEPLRVEEIRRLRQIGLTVPQEGEEG
jgi:hypothetical protein